jgi:hypothetical protein
MRDRRADDKRRVRDPAGDHDLRARLQAARDTEGAEIRVGGERIAQAEFGAAFA